MNRALQAAIFLTVAAAAGFAGYYFNQAKLSSPATAAAAQQLLQAPLAGLDGKEQRLAQRGGKVLLVNFWATWCPPCREEIPELMKIQRKYAPNGFEVVGIALDNVAKVRDYANEMGIDYALLIAGAEGLAISKDLGNRAGVLPFTVVLDRSGTVAFTHAGALTEAKLDVVIKPLI